VSTVSHDYLKLKCFVGSVHTILGLWDQLGRWDQLWPSQSG